MASLMESNNLNRTREDESRAIEFNASDLTHPLFSFLLGCKG